MLPHLNQIKRAALDFLFPQRCLGCGKEGVLLCDDCQKSLVRIVTLVCPKCGKPQPSGLLCPSCLNWKSSLDGIRSPFKFEGLVRETIHQFKYNNLRSLAHPLAALLRDFWLLNPLPGTLLIPVPLHPKRLRERGYNQSALLAEELGKMIRMPVVKDILIRVKHILPQVQTHSAEERRTNVAQAFQCRSALVKDSQVILVDDVATSGATLDACAAALKLAGVTSVWGLVLAREI